MFGDNSRPCVFYASVFGLAHFLIYGGDLYEKEVGIYFINSADIKFVFNIGHSDDAFGI